MKKNMLTSILLAAVAFTGCTKLDVAVESELTPSNFPKSEAEYIAAIGPVYTQLATRYAVDYWRLQEFSTDAAIIPARAGNYDDGGRFRDLHKHTWTADHVIVRDVWEWGFGGINTCNRILSLMEEADEGALKSSAIAELRTMRAFYYFMMMDLYGNVPLITSFPVTEQPLTAQRPEVFAFIETELKAALPNLTTATGQLTYGRANKWLAFAILEKMYLNAAYYIGEDRYTQTVAMADSILVGNHYSLDDDYKSIFMPDNGPAIKETIFAVPYDANLVAGNHFNRYGLHTGLQAKYELPFRPSIAMSTIRSFWEKFDLTGDIRNETWLAGKQYNNDGSPIMINTTKKGLDDSYSGSDGGTAISWQLEFFPDLVLRGDPDDMDIGNDETAKAEGVRSIKFYPDKNANPSTRYQNTDVPVFRLADVLLMKAEAILRGATATTVNGELQTPDVLVNKVRARADAPAVTDITLDELLDERVRELAWEAWRRNDLLRYGKFEDSWGFKTNDETYRRVFPVPNTEISLNPKLSQNPQYQ